MSENIFSNLYDFLYIYPPILIIIYSIIIIYTKCDLNIPEFIKEVFTFSEDTLKLNKIIENGATSNKTEQIRKKLGNRTDKLKQTNNRVLILFGLIASICYLIIRYFMYGIKDKLNSLSIKCVLNKEAEETIKKYIKETNPNADETIINSEIKKKQKQCDEAGKKQNDKFNKCISCIDVSDEENRLICEVNDSNNPNTQIVGELNETNSHKQEKCKFFNDKISGTSENIESDIDKHKRQYFYDNFSVYLLIMFLSGILIYKYGKFSNTSYYLGLFIPWVIIAIIILIILGGHFKWEKENYDTYWFNILLIVISLIINWSNMSMYKIYFTDKKEIRNVTNIIKKTGKKMNSLNHINLSNLSKVNNKAKEPKNNPKRTKAVMEQHQHGWRTTYVENE